MKKYLVLILISFLWLSCANQVPPSGGPDDKTAPTVIYNFPEDKALNFKDNRVLIEFDKYIDKKTLSESFFISPYIKDEVEFIWSKRELTIKLPDTLKENQTYVLTFGSGITDIRRNKMDKPFTLTFSTGNELDSCEISGKVYSEKYDNVEVLLYKINGLDSINFEKTKADYISFVNNFGEFEIKGLAKGKYKIISVKDELKNLQYDMDKDLIGFWYKDIEITDSLNKIQEVFIELGKCDTLMPKLNSIRSVSNNHIQLNFSEAIDSSRLSLDKFLLSDSLNSETIKLFGFYNGENNSQIVNLICRELIPEKTYRLIAKNIPDKSGNYSDIDTLFFTGIPDKDTLPPKLFSKVFGDKSDFVDYLNPKISFRFDKFLLDSYQLSQNIEISDTSKEISDFSLKFTDSSSFDFIPAKMLKPKSKYIIKINYNFVKNINGIKTDTIISYNFSTLDNLAFGEISGVVNNIKNINTPLILELLPISSTLQVNEKLFINNQKNTNFKFGRIREGKYFLKAYLDLNKDNHYTNGNLSGSPFSEPFLIQSDTLKVRGRWPIKEYQLDVEKLFRK